MANYARRNPSKNAKSSHRRPVWPGQAAQPRAHRGAPGAGALERQVRVEGKVERTSAAESDHYFNSRPLKSRIAAIASAQSAPIDSRAALEQHYEAAAAQWGDTPPRPAHWGGFRLVPTRIEFWQGRRSRFHDRVVYTLQDDGSWTRQRLQP